MAKTNTAVATQDDHSQAVAMFGGTEGPDAFGFDSSDLVVPRITVVADLSDFRKKNNAKYIEGAEVGDLVDTSTLEVVAKGYEGETFDFLPVWRSKEALRWKSNRGGLADKHILEIGEQFQAFADKEGLKVNEDYKYLYPNKDELVETWNYIGLDLSRGGMPVIVSFKKTGLKTGKQFNQMMQNARLPNGQKSKVMYSHFYKIGTFEESKDNNNWASISVKKGDFIGNIEGGMDYAAQAKELYDIVRSGAYRTDDSVDDSGDSEIPF